MNIFLIPRSISSNASLDFWFTLRFLLRISLIIHKKKQWCAFKLILYSAMLNKRNRFKQDKKNHIGIFYWISIHTFNIKNRYTTKICRNKINRMALTEWGTGPLISQTLLVTGSKKKVDKKRHSIFSSTRRYLNLYSNMQ